MASIEPPETELVKRLRMLKERLAAQGRHREAAIVDRAIGDEGPPAGRARGDLR